MTCCGCCKLDTPQSIMDEGNDYYEETTDIFSEVINTVDGAFEHGDVMRKALWHGYRLRMIASCNTPEWVQAMADKLDIVGPKWDALISKAADTDLTDMTEMSYKRSVKNHAIAGTDGDVRTVSHSGSDTDILTYSGQDMSVVGRTGTDTKTVETEDMPQTPIQANERYLSGRTTETDAPGVTETTTVTPGTTETRTMTPGVIDTDKFMPNNQTDEDYSEERDISAVTFRKLIENYPEILSGFIKEFESYFLAVLF